MNVFRNWSFQIFWVWNSEKQLDLLWSREEKMLFYKKALFFLNGKLFFCQSGRIILKRVGSTTNNLYLCTWKFSWREIITTILTWILFINYVLYSTLLHLPPLRFQRVGGCWEWTQGQLRRWHWQSDTLTTRLDLIPSFSSVPPANSWGGGGGGLAELLYVLKSTCLLIRIVGEKNSFQQAFTKTRLLLVGLIHFD